MSSSTFLGQYDFHAQVWAVIERLYNIGREFSIAFSQALVLLISFAYGEKNYSRQLQTSFSCLLISISIETTVSFLFVFMPQHFTGLRAAHLVFLSIEVKLFY
jgi:Na+-driven multidrug efflux pump